MGKFRKMKSFFILVTFFLLEFQLSVAHNLFYCADFSCQEPISTGKTLLRYNGRSEKHLSFSKNDDIKVLSKPFGDDGEDWVAFCRGKVGLVPKNMVREMKMFKYDTKIQLPFENLPFWSTNTPKIIETADNYIDNPEDDKSRESFEFEQSESQEGDYSSEFNSSEIEPESQEQPLQKQQQPEITENQESHENESQSENNNKSDEKPTSPPILEISPVPKTPNNLETQSESKDSKTGSDPVLKAQPLVEPKVVVTATHIDGNQDQVAANTNNNNLDPAQVIPVDQEGTKTIEASINEPVPVPLPAPAPQGPVENSSEESYPSSDTNSLEQSLGLEASSNADTKTDELAQHPPLDPLVSVSENKIEIQTDQDHPLNQETGSSESESAQQIPSSDGDSKLKGEKIQYPKPVVVSSFPGPDSDLGLNSQSLETETGHNSIGGESVEYLPEPPEEVDQADKIQADNANTDVNHEEKLQNSASTETETGSETPTQENDVDSASATSIFSAVKSFSSNIINSVLPEDLQHDGTSSENENLNTASINNYPGAEIPPSTETPISTVDSVKEEELPPPPVVPEQEPVAVTEGDINTETIQERTTPKSIPDSELQEPAASVPDIVVNEVETSTPSTNSENENSNNEEIRHQHAAEIPVSPETVVPDATITEKIVTSPQEQQDVPLSKLPHLEGEISGEGPPVVETPGSVFKSPSMDLDDDLININVLRAQLDDQLVSDANADPEPEPETEPEQQASPDEKVNEVDVDSNNNVVPSENSEPEPPPVDSHSHGGQDHVHEGHDHHDHEGHNEGNDHDHDHSHGHSHSHGHHRHRHPQSPEDTNGSSTMSIIVVVKHLSSTLLSFLPEYLQDTILDVDDALVFTGIIALTLVSICVPYFLMESFLSVRPLKKQVVELNKTLWKVSAAYENQQEEFDTYKKKALAYDEDQKRIEQLEMELQILKKLEGKQKEQVKLLQKQLKTSARAADGIEDLIETAIKEKEIAIEDRNLLKLNYARIETTLKVKCEELEEAQASGSAIALDLEVLNHEKDNLFKRSKSLEMELELLKKKLASETEIRRVKEEEREKIAHEKDVILTELTDLKRILHQYEDNASSLAEELTTKENELLALKETLGDDSPLIDISETKAKLKSVEEEAASLKSRLDTVAYENTSLTRDIEETKKELCETKVVKEEAENQLKVLEGWFKKKEQDLRSAVAKLELEQSIKHKDKDDLVKMIREKESEVQHFFSTNDGLKQEIDDMKAAHRNELRTAEAKADEHWLSLCQSERKTADARKEAELLRQKLVALVKEKDGDDGDLLSGMGDVPLYALPLDMVPPPVPDDLSYFPLDDDFIPPLPLPLPLGSEAMRLQPLGRLSPQNTPNNNYTSYMDDDTISPIVRGNGHGGGHGHGHGHGHGDRGSISGGGGGGGGGRGDYSDDSSRSDSPLDHRRPGSRDNWINDNRNDQPGSHSQSRRRGGGGGPNPNQGQRGHGGSGGSGPKTSSPIPHGVNL